MAYLQSMFLNSDQPSLLLMGNYSLGLVLFSVLVAVLASTLALQVADTARQAAHSSYRQVAILSSSVVLGGGIWSMHFIGMLAFQICAEANYSPGVTLLSMLPGLAASWVALQLLTRDSARWTQLIGCGVLVGAGIGAMHYSGMAAMSISSWLRYDPFWFGASIVFAVAVAILALWLRFHLLHSRLSKVHANAVAGLVMGAAISGMHYMGMAAGRFVGIPAVGEEISSHAIFIASLVGITTVLLTLIVVSFNGLLRYRELNQRLRISEQHLRSLVETAVDGIITINHRGAIASVNPAVERLFGWTARELVGQPMERVMPEDYALEFRGHLQRYLETGEVQLIGRELELGGLLRDGTQVPVRLSLGLMHDGEGRPLFVAFVADISLRKRMEQTLREREQQYASLIRNIPGVSFRCLLDADWSMLFVSEAVERLTGWKPEDFIERRISFAQLYHPDDLAPVAETVMQAVQQGRNYVVEYRIIDRDGREHWLWESGSAVRDDQGQAKWIDGVLLDVTDTKLRNAEYEGTVNAISRVMGVIEFDMDGTILAVNENLLSLCGYSEAELIGKHHAVFCELDYVDSEEYTQFWTRLRQGEYHAGEYRRLRKDGGDFWIQASYNPIFDADGRPFKVVKFATDISARRQMESELREAKNRAEQAAASKTTFLANMSHEIRTPMNAIIGFTDLLLGSNLSEQQRHHLGTVRQSAHSLLGLLNDILDTAKLERGAFELEQVDFPLRQILEQVLESLRLGAMTKGLTLELDYHPALADHFCGDPLRIRQIITNLAGNAVKFTERGCVRVVAFPDHGQVHLLVRDTGIGIPADRLAQIFDPFAQADASMSRRFGGTGLGTSIARQLVELMGGRIWVESELGVGSLFHVLVPLAPGKAPLDVPTPLVVAQLPTLRILIADDVPQNVELLSTIFQDDGHHIVTARDGQEALEAFQRETFDVVLMDVQMPRMDGLEATRCIRRLEAAEGREATPVIAVSASVLEEDQRIAQEAGMDGFATKPLEIPRLLREIARVLGTSLVSGEVVRTPIDNAAEVIDWTSGQRLWGSEHALHEAIARFLDEHQSDVEALQQALQQTDYETAIGLAHRLRGAAGNLSLAQLYRLASELEFGCKQHADAEVQALLGMLQNALAEVRSALAEHADEAPQVGSGNVDLALLRQAVGELTTSLRRGELDEQALATVEQVLRGGGLAISFVRFNQALQDFEFDRAVELLEESLVELEGDREKDIEDA